MDVKFFPRGHGKLNFSLPAQIYWVTTKLMLKTCKFTRSCNETVKISFKHVTKRKNKNKFSNQTFCSMHKAATSLEDFLQNAVKSEKKCASEWNLKQKTKKRKPTL